MMENTKKRRIAVFVLLNIFSTRQFIDGRLDNVFCNFLLIKDECRE
jgi:hypothetical protein